MSWQMFRLPPHRLFYFHTGAGVRLPTAVQPQRERALATAGGNAMAGGNAIGVVPREDLASHV
jgi:hypothetical protein